MSLARGQKRFGRGLWADDDAKLSARPLGFCECNSLKVLLEDPAGLQEQSHAVQAVRCVRSDHGEVVEGPRRLGHEREGRATLGT